MAAAVIVGVVGLPGPRRTANAGAPTRLSATRSAHEPARAAHEFLASWVDRDGRVVRRDQGADTVSEGQGYAMLLAAAVRDRAAFGRIWNWTRQHLQRPDGSFAWHWQDGRVVDDEPATDADLDIVRALQTGAALWHDRSYTAAADRTAAATLRSSTIPVDEGRLLVAGPWATGSSTRAATIDPSYLVAGTARSLARTTGQAGWTAVARGTAAMDATLLHGGALPPDWATLPAGAHSATQVVPAPAPQSSTGVAYGLDAPRLLVRLATSCDTADRRLAAAAPTSATTMSAPAIRSLDGTPLVGWRNPLTDVAAAAVLEARGRTTAAGRAVDAADAQQRTAPTYYGAAWTALGRIELTTDRLGDCAARGAS